MSGTEQQQKRAGLRDFIQKNSLLKSLPGAMFCSKGASREATVIFYSMLITLLIFSITYFHDGTTGKTKPNDANITLLERMIPNENSQPPRDPVSPYGRVVLSHSPKNLFDSDEAFMPFDFRGRYTEALDNSASMPRENSIAEESAFFAEDQEQEVAIKDAVNQPSEALRSTTEQLNEHMNYLSSGLQLELDHHIQQTWKLAPDLHREAEAITALRPLIEITDRAIANLAQEAIDDLSQTMAPPDSLAVEETTATASEEENVYRELLNQATLATDPQQRFTAIAEIGSRQVDGSLEPLEQVVFTDPVVENRIQAINGLTDLAIAKIQPDRITQTLTALTEDGHEKVAASARTALDSLLLANEQTVADTRMLAQP